MKKLLLIVLFLPFVQGCLYQTVNKSEVDLANKYCENKGGLDYIKEGFGGATTIVCEDSTRTSENIAREEVYK